MPSPDSNRAFPDRIVPREGVVLRNFTALDEGMLRRILSWRNRPEIRRLSREGAEISESDHFAFVGSLADRSDRCYYLLSERQVPVGVVNLAGIDWDSKRAEFGIYKDPDQQRPAGRLLMEAMEFLVFEVLALSRINLTVHKENAPAMSLYRKFGYAVADRGGPWIRMTKGHDG